MSMGDYYRALASRRDKGTLPPTTSATEAPIKIEDDEDEGSKVRLSAILGEPMEVEDEAAHVPEETQVEEGRVKLMTRRRLGTSRLPFKALKLLMARRRLRWSRGQWATLNFWARYLRPSSKSFSNAHLRIRQAQLTVE